MFVYLSKKIAIPNCNSVTAVSWSNDQGYISCGGDNLLKVLKLDSSDNKETLLSMNQTLEGHSGCITLTVWNRQHDKLTTADENGLIIVWVLYKGMWYEEMINNRGKGRVSGMQWSKNGEKIGIVYEDGAVILGSVDGNRIWGKEIKNTRLDHICWDPNSLLLLFANTTGQLQLFDSQGTYVGKVQDFCHAGMDVRISSMDWYNGLKGYIKLNIPCLAICYEDGKVQILRDQQDQNPVIFDTNLTKTKIQWNTNGSVLAICGIQNLRGSSGEEKETCVVQFWSPMGEYLRSIKIPGKTISSISWEKDGLRLVIAVDSFLYFANIKPDYQWAYFDSNVCHAFQTSESSHTKLMYWNPKSGEQITKTVQDFLFMTANGQHCLTVRKSPIDPTRAILAVCNGIGVQFETKTIDFIPKYAALNKSTVIVASESIILQWTFKSLTSVKPSALDSLRRKENRDDKYYHIDDIQSGEKGITLQDLILRQSTVDPISSITVSDSVLLLGRQSGCIIHVNLPVFQFEVLYHAPISPSNLAINSNSTRFSILDKNGVLRLHDLNTKTHSGNLIEVERKDVWDLKWSLDNPQMLAVSEKTKTFVINGVEVEEPQPSTGYLELMTVDLDVIIQERKSTKMEAKWLQEVRMVVAEKGISTAFQFAQEKSQNKLWKVIAEKALEELDFEAATKAFAASLDYQGLQFIKRIKKIDDPKKKMAEIATFFEQFEKAEKIYLEMDRKDLAVDLRTRIGDWFRVVQLLKTGAGGDDHLLEQSWDAIGDYYYDRQRWQQAITYYIQAKNNSKLVELYFLLEDYDNVEKLGQGLDENSPLLRAIAERFALNGLSQQAVNVYLKIGDVAEAVNTCIQLNQWGKAIELAEIHRFKEIQSLLTQYAQHILSQNRFKEAVELYRKANLCQESAGLLFQMANQAKNNNESLLHIKKLFVLGALEVERFHALQKSNRHTATAALDGLLKEDLQLKNSKLLEHPWRGAEAYHFYILAQRQFNSGQLEQSVITALHLRDYEDILGASVIYSLLALVSVHAGYYGTCSKAFIRLESLEDPQAEHYKQLAVDIFTRYKPQDPEDDTAVCSNCLSSMKESEFGCSHCHIQYPACIASGRPVLEQTHFMCHVCKHRALESEVATYIFCPLCHTSL